MIRLLLIVSIFIFSGSLISKENAIIVASTTSTSDSGLLDYLNEYFENIYNIKVHVLSLGTGQALRTAQDGNVEILLVHHKDSELKFIENGFGLVRYNLMYNDFIIVGPKEHKSSCLNIEYKLKLIYEKKLTFISRGDDSGTHKKELDLWKLLNFDTKDFESWYKKVGQGMGNTLLISNEKSAFTISDRATWIAFNKKDNLKIICENLPPLLNQYGLILVNPDISNNLNIQDAKIYIDWLISDEGKQRINNFKKNGQQLFFYNHH
jgi:tungstate transport system substrate-binding protein